MNVMSRLRETWERFKLVTDPEGRLWQQRCAIRFCENIFRHAPPVVTGRLVYEALPQEMANNMIGSEFDPYNTAFNKDDLYRWVIAHVVFDSGGQVIGLCGDGKVIAATLGYALTTDIYAQRKKELLSG